MYQRQRALNECPGFLASVQVDAGANVGPLFVALRSDALEIYTADDTQFLFDLEGRPVRFSTPNEYRFRGVSHQGSVARKRSREQGGGFERSRLAAAELERCCAEAWTTGTHAHRALAGPGEPAWAHPDPAQARAQLLPILAKIVGFTPSRLAAEAIRFAEIYRPVPILPPDHYASLVLQATEGCTFNTCTFCALYRGTTFRVRAVDEFEQHIDAALAFHGEGLRRFTQIFLGQANALAVPQPRLVPLLEAIRRRLELPDASEGPGPARPSWAQGHRTRFLGIGSFLDGFTGLAKSVADYEELRALGLTRVYLGVESGSADLLRFVDKPAQPDEILETLRRLKAAGLATDVILLVGVGGAAFAEEHVRATLEFLTASPLRPGDRVYLSEMVESPAAPYGEHMDAKGRARLTPAETREQKAQFGDGIRRLGLQAVPYRIEPFIY